MLSRLVSPWGFVTSPLFGHLAVYGYDKDGILIIILSVAGALAFFLSKRYGGVLGLVFDIAGFAGVVGIVNSVRTSIGPGPPPVLVGGIGMLVASVIALREREVTSMQEVSRSELGAP